MKLYVHSFIHQRGFTLIELLVVISIIGILASFIVANLNESRGQTRDAERLNDLKQIQIALELYYNANRSYPSSLSTVAPDFIQELPVDPATGDDYVYQTENSEQDYAIQATNDREDVKCEFKTTGATGITDSDKECPF